MYRYGLRLLFYTLGFNCTHLILWWQNPSQADLLQRRDGESPRVPDRDLRQTAVGQGHGQTSQVEQGQGQRGTAWGEPPRPTATGRALITTEKLGGSVQVRVLIVAMISNYRSVGNRTQLSCSVIIIIVVIINSVVVVGTGDELCQW